MKIYVAAFDPVAMGGGHSFTRNFVDTMPTSSYDEADIYFIPSASMVQPDEVDKAKADGKKIVLRCDNIILNSRNRNTGMSRMRKYSEMADLVVFQSKFAEELLNPYLHSENYTVILNGVNQSIFNATNRVKTAHRRFIYAKHSSNETKNWEIARVTYQKLHQDAPDSVLNLVGRFDGNVEQYNFDFYNGENFKYWGLISDQEYMASVYKQSDYFLYSYYNDACSQTLIEAISCGVKVLDCCGMSQTGGTPEILKAYDEFGVTYFNLERMSYDYQNELGRL